MRIGLVTNGAVRRGRAGDLTGRALRAINARGADVVVLDGRTAMEKQERAHRAATSGAIDALMVVGGDGTVHIGVEALTATGVPLGIIPVGSGNDIARQFGLPVGDVEESVERTLLSLRTGAATPVDVVEVRTGGAAGATHRALAILSAGIDAAINLRANGLAWPGGNLRYLRAALAEVRRFAPYGLRLEIDGRAAEGPATLVCVANTGYFGGGLRIAPAADPRDGLLDVVYAKVLSPAQICALFPRLYTGGHVRHPYVHVKRARHVRIAAAPGVGKAPPVLMADGEVMGRLPVEVRCLPRSLELLA
ncbi:MAG: diacylglycerol kinase family protein [Actinomycetaceae bacterium]|nr:diacylglycerol kinase family protein [Actinomycetaceae bacterium]